MYKHIYVCVYILCARLTELSEGAAGTWIEVIAIVHEDRCCPTR